MTRAGSAWLGRPGSGRGCRAAAWLLVAMLAACATPAERRADQAERRAWAEAVGTVTRDPEAGAEALRGFVRTYPESPLVADARLRLAELALEAKRPEQARAQLRRALEAHPEAPASVSVRLLLARLERAQGRPAEAYRLASELALEKLEPRRRREAHRLLADLAGEAQRPAQRVAWLARVRADQAEATQRAAVDREIESAVEALDADGLARAAELLGRRVPAARVRLEQAERHLAAGDPEAARRVLAAAEKLPLARGDAERLAELRSALEQGRLAGELRLPAPSPDARPPAVDASRAMGVLGVALPLSGEWAAFGEEALQGILLAAGLPGSAGFDGAAPSAVVLRVRDTTGLPARAALAAAELAGDPEVSALVGPLLADAALAAGDVAERTALPLLALTRSEEASRGRRYVMTLGASPRLQAELLAEYAVDGLGLGRFAILYPDDAYGRRLRAAFWTAVERRGGRVVGISRYAPDATDFAGPIRRLVGYELLSAGERAALAERERMRKRAKRLAPEQAAELREEARALTAPDGSALPPFVDFEAVFVPDGHENVALLASHLAFHDVRGVRLLGLSGLQHPDLIAIGGEHVEGAVFTADFDPDARAPHRAAFARRYRETFGREPGFLAAQAYDATQLALYQLQMGRREREAFLEGLRRVESWPGVSGVIAIGADGQVAKRPLLRGVERGAFVSVDERGEPPRLPAPPAPDESDPVEPDARAAGRADATAERSARRTAP